MTRLMKTIEKEEALEILKGVNCDFPPLSNGKIRCSINIDFSVVDGKATTRSSIDICDDEAETEWWLELDDERQWYHQGYSEGCFWTK